MPYTPTIPIDVAFGIKELKFLDYWSNKYIKQGKDKGGKAVRIFSTIVEVTLGIGKTFRHSIYMCIEIIPQFPGMNC